MISWKTKDKKYWSYSRKKEFIFQPPEKRVEILSPDRGGPMRRSGFKSAAETPQKSLAVNGNVLPSSIVKKKKSLPDISPRCLVTYFNLTSSWIHTKKGHFGPETHKV